MKMRIYGGYVAFFLASGFLMASLAVAEERLANPALESYAAKLAEAYADLPAVELRPKSALADDLGQIHVRFSRTHRGLDVDGGELVGHLDQDGVYRGANGYLRKLNLDVRPVLGANAALDLVRRTVAGPADLTCRLVILIETPDSEPELTWHVTAQNLSEEPVSLHEYFVSARSGEVLLDYDNSQTGDALGSGQGWHYQGVSLHTDSFVGPMTPSCPDDYIVTNGYRTRDLTRGGFETHNACLLSNPVPNILLDEDNIWGGDAPYSTGVDAHYGTAKAWDYFAAKHARNGFDGLGTRVVAFVEWPQNNARFFPPDKVKFGYNIWGRPITMLDVVGHEWAHMVTWSSAELRYANQPGGLNESTSDIFGTMIEFQANNPEDPGDYLIAEKGGNPRGFNRNMCDPPSDGNSIDHVSGYYDQMNVHFSSGIGNKVFCLLANGGTHYGVTVQSIGRVKAAKIWYRALTVYFTTTTNFSQARGYCIQAATDIGYGNATVQSVRDAWRSVGVN